MLGIPWTAAALAGVGTDMDGCSTEKGDVDARRWRKLPYIMLR